ncbi:MAG: hypothetical protein ABIO70_32560 [Pseudomonadota bacterium]
MSLNQALDEIRERSGGEGGRANLPDIGNWLKDAGVDTGGRKLSDILRSMPQFCRVEGGTVVFEGGEPTAEDAGEKPRVLQHLHPALFHAFIKDEPGQGHWMHLKTYKVVQVTMEEGQPGPPVSEADFEYVLIPTISTEDQKEFARDVLSSKLDDEALAYVLAPDDASWIKRGRDTVPPEVWAEFWDRRRDWVVQRGIDWLRAHRIPVESFVRRMVLPGSAESARRSPPIRVGVLRGNGATQALRKKLHAAIDGMTIEELCELRVPARFLIEM